MADTITYRLSSIDQSIIRAYTRYSLIFPCGNEATTREQVVTNLMASVKRAIYKTCVNHNKARRYVDLLIVSRPILAGKIHAIEDGNEAALRDSALHDSISIEGIKQAGRVEARVTLAQVNAFKPTINVPSVEDFPHKYEDLAAANMPAAAFINEALTPLPDSVCNTLPKNHHILQGVQLAVAAIANPVASRFRGRKSNVNEMIARRSG